MTDYDECPYCDRLFPTLGPPAALQIHIREDHHMVKIYRGGKSRWIPEDEAKKLYDAQSGKGKERHP